MQENEKAELRRPIWAYAYEMLPPQSEDRMRSIQILLDDAHADALERARTWSGGFVRDQRITHILIVSDSPEVDEGINERLEAGLRSLDAPFARTAPMIVTDDS
jgi:hypothetical protein